MVAVEAPKEHAKLLKLPVRKAREDVVRVRRAHAVESEVEVMPPVARPESGERGGRESRQPEGRNESDEAEMTLLVMKVHVRVPIPSHVFDVDVGGQRPMDLLPRLLALEGCIAQLVPRIFLRKEPRVRLPGEGGTRGEGGQAGGEP